MKRLMPVLLWLPSALWYRLIWGFSAQTAAVSGGASDGLLERLLAALCPAYTASGTEIQDAAVELLSFYIRKGAHMFLYFVLALLVWLALAALLKSRTKRAFAALLLCAVLAALDEYHQTLVPGRSGAARDVLIDLTGVAIALLLFSLPVLAQWLQRNMRRPQRLWLLAAVAGAVLLVYTGCLTAPAPLFVARAARLEYFIQLPPGERGALLQAAAPILREGLFLFLAALTGFCSVCLAALSGRPRAAAAAMATAALLSGAAGALWRLPLIPGLLLTLCAGAAALLLWLLFPLLKR